MTPYAAILRALGPLVLAAFVALTSACVSKLPLGGTRCPCAEGYCCVRGKCEQKQGTATCPSDPGATLPDTGAPDEGDPTPDAGSDGEPTDALTTEIHPTVACGSLPGSFALACGDCHTAIGAPNSRYPDLYKFMGTASQLKAKVRMGGTGMAPYPPSLISDADLDGIYAHFTRVARPALDAIELDPVVPLFGKMDARNPPVVVKRADGSIVTRGAGRVRGRHEGPANTNQPFMEWVPDYYVGRTYGWIVEDYTPRGESKVTVTFLPNGPVTTGTNFRAWKQYDAGDVFAMNLGMISDVPVPSMVVDGLDVATTYRTRISGFSLAQSAHLTTNTRTSAAIQVGDRFEFEFALWIPTEAVMPPGSRTAYYTDQFRYQVGRGGVTADNIDHHGGLGTLGPALAAQSGGDGTNVWAYYLKETQFDQMALDVQHENVQNLVEGRRLFNTNFATGAHAGMGQAPFPEQAGKSDDKAQQTSCVSCHVNNGPGQPIELGDIFTGTSMTVKLFNAGGLGAQLQPNEGFVDVTGSTTKTVVLGDGSSITLTRPTFAVRTVGGTWPWYSLRLARSVIGLGLLEAIDERTIVARADQRDCDHNGISGRPSLVKDPVTGETRLGRFGWKAETSTIAREVSVEANESMDVDATELGGADLDKLVTYLRLVSVPGQRDHDVATVRRGEQVFQTIGCADCHATDVVTGPHHPFAELRDQAIKPYTDLLLHDMGPDLADESGFGAPDLDAAAPAAASEWRTPPLWGIGLLSTINGHTRLLHDGRAASVTEAVLWHGGEGEAALRAFLKLSLADRTALLDFVSSL